MLFRKVVVVSVVTHQTRTRILTMSSINRGKLLGLSSKQPYDNQLQNLLMCITNRLRIVNCAPRALPNKNQYISLIFFMKFRPYGALHTILMWRSGELLEDVGADLVLKGVGGSSILLKDWSLMAIFRNFINIFLPSEFRSSKREVQRFLEWVWVN